MPISRDAIRPAALPQELIDVPEIGGEVIVRGMSLPQLMQFAALQRRAFEPRDDEVPEETHARAAVELMPFLLHHTVLADDLQPVYSKAEWVTFCSAHVQASQRLWRAAMALSGQPTTAQEAEEPPKP